MTQDQVREVVKITIDELTKRKLLQIESYQTILRAVEVNLYRYFDSRGEGTNTSYALHVLSDDPYIDIIYLQYRDGKTLEWIAEVLNKDVSTVKRNKKRLILSIYELMEGDK